MVFLKNGKLFGWSFVVFFLIILAYAPILGSEFGYHNDYRIWEYQAQDCCFGFLETRHLLGIGRPLLAFLVNIHFMFISSMAALQISQIVSIISIGIMATLCFLHFQREINISRLGAALLALLMFTLPSMAINSFWVANYTSEIIPLFIAFFAYTVLQKQTSNTYYRVFIIGSAAFLLFIDLLIYPPTTFFFLTLSFIKLLFGPQNPKQARLRQLLTELLVILTVCLLYFICLKLIWKPFLLNHPLFLSTYLKEGGRNWQDYYQGIDGGLPQYRVVLGFDLKGKAHQIKDYIIFVFSAWFPLLKDLVFIVLLPFLAILFWSASQNPYLTQFGLTARRIIGFVLLFIIVVLTALPVLAGPSEYQINYRILFASMSLVPAALVFAIERIASGHNIPPNRQYVMLAIATVFILAAEWSSFHRLTLVVKRSADEYQWIYSSIEKNITDTTREIRVQVPNTPRPNRRFLRADFALDAAGGGVGGITGIVNIALQELHRDPKQYTVVFGSEFLPDRKGTSIVIEPM